MSHQSAADAPNQRDRPRFPARLLVLWSGRYPPRGGMPMRGVQRVADWSEVRNQELSEMVTRRLEAGLLPPQALARLVMRWAHQGLLPPEAPGEIVLRLIDAHLLDKGLDQS